MVAHDVIVIRASAGGVEALIRMVSQLPDTLAASLFVVTHFPVQSNSLLPQILNRYGHLQATHYECHVGHTYSFDSLMAGIPRWLKKLYGLQPAPWKNAPPLSASCSP